MKRVLVTGAGGFVGREVLRPLTSRGYEIIATTSSAIRVADPAVNWVACNLLDEAESESLIVSTKPTHLLHLAWYTEHGKFWNGPENLAWLAASVRILGSFVAQGGRRAVVAGSCAEYDWQSTQPCVENSTPLRPHTLYGVCKKALFDVASAVSVTTGLSFACGRIFLLHGRNESPGRFVPSLIDSLMTGRAFPMTDGRQRRDLLHVSDVADALVALLDSAVAGPVNIGSGVPVRLLDVATQVARSLDAVQLLQPGSIEPRPDDPAELYPDVSRLRDEVGWSPRLSLSEGLDDSVRWWRERNRAG